MSVFAGVLRGRRSGDRLPTHEDALQSSRAVMKRALGQIAFWGEDEAARRVALDALAEENRVYRVGVLRAVD